MLCSGGKSRVGVSGSALCPGPVQALGGGRAAAAAPASSQFSTLFMGMIDISKPVKVLGRSRWQMQPLPSGLAEMAGHMRKGLPVIKIHSCLLGLAQPGRALGKAWVSTDPIPLSLPAP